MRKKIAQSLQKRAQKAITLLQLAFQDDHHLGTLLNVARAFQLIPLLRVLLPISCILFPKIRRQNEDVSQEMALLEASSESTFPTLILNQFVGLLGYNSKQMLGLTDMDSVAKALLQNQRMSYATKATPSMPAVWPTWT